jgi:putative hemolysin
MVDSTGANQLDLRLVRAGPELEAAQTLRFEVFYREMGAHPTPEMLLLGRDFDRYDTIADHLVVVDLDRSPDRTRPCVVGCYRMLRGSVATRHGGFYTSGEFDLAGVRAPYGEIMELGRSCVHADYRSGAVMQLLWRGIADYLEAFDVGLMLGCASLPGTEPEPLAEVLSYLHHYHLAPPEVRPRAVPSRFVRTNRLPREQINERQVFRNLPPLLRGYLSIGGMIGEGAVVDHEFNTTDVCLVLPTPVVQARSQRLFRHLRPAVAAAA